MILESFKKINNEKGISLIELLVAVSIFSLVMIATTGIFINAIKAQKAMIAKQNVAENMRYVMEFMVKEIRMAQVDSADPTLTFKDNTGGQFNASDSPSSAMSFFISNGDEIKYYLDTTDTDGDGRIDEIMRKDITGGISGQSISSEEVSITGLSFEINNWDITAGSAPLITILMKAKAKNGVGGEMEMQTSVSPRTY